MLYRLNCTLLSLLHRVERAWKFIVLHMAVLQNSGRRAAWTQFGLHPPPPHYANFKKIIWPEDSVQKSKERQDRAGNLPSFLS
jgi:hypothetical protein